MLPEIQKIISDLSLSDRSPGLSLLLTKNNQVVSASCVGYADEQYHPIADTSNFRIASVTKQFTAVAVLQLVEQGKLGLGTSLCEALPDFPEYGRPVTIHHLLSHTSGIPPYERHATGTYEPYFSDRDVLDVLKKVTALEFEPGTAYHYSNAAYCLLALIIEKRTGTTYAKFIEENIFKKSNMPYSVVGPSKDIPSRVYGYSRGVAGWVLNDQNTFSKTQGDGGIYTSATELTSWQHHLYQRKTLLSDKSLSCMTQSHTPTNYEGEDYGYGIAITKLANETCYLHHGTSSGFENALFYVPRFDISLAILSNTSGTELNAITLGKQILMNHSSELFR